MNAKDQVCVIADALCNMRPVTPTQKRVLVVMLALHAAHGYPPSIYEIGATLGVTHHAIRKALRSLEDRGIVSTKKGRRCMKVLGVKWMPTLEEPPA